MALLLGCIADDVTGASDLALMLSQNGVPAALCLGMPDPGKPVTTPAVVIALKIRTEPAQDAVALAEDAARWLIDHDAGQIFFKYCSTFDSTAKGNIGPVADALLTLAGESFTVLLPAFPDNARTVRQGNLYVGDVPLAESPMRHHPLTPMTESSLPVLMDAQTSPGCTGLVEQAVVDRGSSAIKTELQRLRRSGMRYAAVDTARNSDFETIAEAVSDLKVLTGGSGIAQGLAAAYRREGLIDSDSISQDLPKVAGNAAVLAGSCSAATQAQVDAYKDQVESIEIDPETLLDSENSSDQLADRACEAADRGNVLVYSTTDPYKLKLIQEELGTEESAVLVENAIAHISRRLADAGIRKFVIAGGETSGAVAKALSIREVRIGPQIDPGVPWMYTPDEPQIVIAFKSGNFGAPDFFQKSLQILA